MALLTGDVRNRDNWSAQTPAGGAALVTVSAHAREDEALAHPLSRLAFTQRRVPLKLDLQRFGRTPIIGDKRLEITEVRVGDASVTPTYSSEFFARSNFIELSSEQKLAQPSFEPLPAGIEVGSTAYSVAPDLAVPLDYETVYMDPDQPDVKPVRDTVRFGLRFDHLVLQASHAEVARSQLRIEDRLKPLQPRACTSLKHHWPVCWPPHWAQPARSPMRRSTRLHWQSRTHHPAPSWWKRSSSPFPENVSWRWPTIGFCPGAVAA